MYANNSDPIYLDKRQMHSGQYYVPTPPYGGT